MRTLSAIITKGAISFLTIVLLSSVAQAATTADINVTVTVTSVSVTATGSYAFGTVSASSSTVSGTAITVTNNGNVAETFSLKLTDPVGWTAVITAPGSEEYRLSAMFNSDNAGTFVPANHALTTSSVASDGTQFAGDETGASVAAADTRSLWLKFEAPSGTAVTSQQTIVVTVTAAAS
jgi:hypothetical protein